MRTLLLVALLMSGGCAWAQTVAPDDVPPRGIESPNILDVRPEVKPDASSLAGYLEQDNAQRNAVQPGNNAPLWRDVANGRPGTAPLPASEAPESGVLVQRQVQYPGSRYTTAGEAWRQVRNQRLIPYGGVLLLLALGAIALFHLVKGPMGRHGAEGGGARVERFTRFERIAHWTNATAFCALAISGLVMAFGKFVLLPVMGATVFAVLASVLKTLHNVAGPVFAVSLLVVFLTFVRDNGPQRGDLQWLREGGGMFGRAGAPEPPSHRFNAGEKLIFWLGVLLLGVLVVGSGLVMDRLVPGLLYERSTMQVAHMVHAAGAILIVCVFAAHIYMGTIGMRGAHAAMRRGWVSEAWAIEHHPYWYQEVRAGASSPVQRKGRRPASWRRQLQR